MTGGLQSTERTQREQPGHILIEHIFIGVCAIVFSAILIHSYLTYSVAMFSYLGYEWHPSWVGVASGMITVFIFCLLMPLRMKRPGDLFLWVIFCVVIIPALILPSVSTGLPLPYVLKFQIVIAGCFLMMLLANTLPLVRVGIGVLTPRGFTILLVSLAIALIVPVAFFWGIPSSIPGFGEVYDVRIANREVRSTAPGIVSYLFGWLSQAIIPFLLVWGIVSRRLSLVFLSLASFLFAYGQTGQKGFLFSLVLLLVIMVGMWVVEQQLVLIIMPALTLVVAVSRFSDLFLSGKWFTALFVNRTFVVQGVLVGYYHEFFTLNPKGHWAYSFLGEFYTDTYGAAPARLIGQEYFSNPATAANANMWADGFANFGYFGMGFVTLVVCTIIWILNSASLGRSRFLVFPLASALAFGFSATSIFTALLSSGMVLVLLLIVVSPTGTNIAGESFRSQILESPAADSGN